MIFSLLALLILPSSSPAARVDGAKMVKLQDGGSAYCSSASDLGKAAYYPSSLELRAIDNDVLEFSSDVSFLTCRKTEEGKFAWANRSPLEPVPSRDIEGRETQVITSKNEFALVASSGRLTSLKPVASDSRQTVSFRLPIQSLISQDEIAALDSGLGVESRMVFFTRAIVKVQLADGRMLPIGLRAGGAYTVLFTMMRDSSSGALVVNGLRLKR